LSTSTSAAAAPSAQSSSQQLEFKFVSKFGKKGKSVGEFSYPVGIQFFYKMANPSTNADFEIYVADQYNHRVQVLNGKTGAWIKNIGTGVVGNKPGEFNRPYDLEISASANELYVLEYANNRISVFNLEDGKFLRHIGDSRNGNNNIIDDDKNVAASNDDEVNKTKNSRKSDDDRLLSGPCGLKLHQNQLLVADTYNHKVKIFGSSAK